ncbi:hypothetical protein M408DRAFT_30718 [Serendipita vermifera MAFF 305830]|uniref:F-box domain-containing protein n=1 Tax=Serendipita vermifera MAFF 305830 TaxID=933852 RepID=A0A0C3AL49_SERVB|nr:hypothetical protein M408DRAFT_30718 [Serendipita vermifera MAFF 305830]
MPHLQVLTRGREYKFDDLVGVLDNSPSLRAFSWTTVFPEDGPYVWLSLMSHPAMRRLTHLELTLCGEWPQPASGPLEFSDLVYLRLFLCDNGPERPATRLDNWGMFPSLRSLNVYPFGAKYTPSQRNDFYSGVAKSCPVLTSLLLEDYKVDSDSLLGPEVWDCSKRLAYFGAGPEFFSNKPDILPPPPSSRPLTLLLHLYSAQAYEVSAETDRRIQLFIENCHEWGVQEVLLAQSWREVKDMLSQEESTGVDYHLPLYAKFHASMADNGISIRDRNRVTVMDSEGTLFFQLLES